ncbi:MAG: EAL domain-containing protein [Rhodospirillales bacterium]
MTRRTTRRVFFAVGAAFLALLPVVASLAFTRGAAIHRGETRVGQVAAQLADHVGQVLWTAEGTLADLAWFARAGCSDTLILEMRAKAAALYAFRGIAYVSPDNRLECTSFGKLQRPIPVHGPPTVIVPAGSLVAFTPPIETDFFPGLSIVAGHRLRHGGWIGVLIPPDLLFGALPADALGTDGTAVVTMAGQRLAGHGDAPPPATERLSATRETSLFETSVTASATRAWALADWRRNLMLNGALGGLAGLALVAAAVHLAGRRSSFADELTDALEDQEFEVHYQPVIDLQRDRCVGAEALIRWRHPVRGLVPPDLFIALAEETGVIVPITRWLMREVGKEMGALLREHAEAHIAVNLAPAHFVDLEVIADAKHAAEEAGIEPRQLLFEVTERGLVDDEGCQRVIDGLAALGSEVAIDDFGTGYSSLAYVGKFRLDYLKIDKAFVATIGTAAASSGLAAIIIEMANQLGLRIIAEGVETEAQMIYLRERGVALAQGWHFSKPLPAADFLAFFRRYNAPPPAAAGG